MDSQNRLKVATHVPYHTAAKIKRTSGTARAQRQPDTLTRVRSNALTPPIRR
jgi:hypothetical protein